MEIVTPSIGLIFWTSLFFLIVLGVLGKFAFKPIVQALEERNNSIAEALGAAERAKEEMKQLNAQNEALLQEARAERDRMMKDAKAAADKMVASAQETAKAEADKIVRAAQDAIENEKKAALTEVRKQVAAISMQVAEKVLRRELADKGAQQSLIENYMKEIN
jgi:F-type H+-transporting ATPase subunit b